MNLSDICITQYCQKNITNSFCCIYIVLMLEHQNNIYTKKGISNIFWQYWREYRMFSFPPGLFWEELICKFKWNNVFHKVISFIAFYVLSHGHIRWQKKNFGIKYVCFQRRLYDCIKIKQTEHSLTHRKMYTYLL